jgi:hypothetical protein
MDRHRVHSSCAFECECLTSNFGRRSQRLSASTGRVATDFHYWAVVSTAGLMKVRLLARSNLDG